MGSCALWIHQASSDRPLACTQGGDPIAVMKPDAITATRHPTQPRGRSVPQRATFASGPGEQVLTSPAALAAAHALAWQEPLPPGSAGRNPVTLEDAVSRQFPCGPPASPKWPPAPLRWLPRSLVPDCRKSLLALVLCGKTFGLPRPFPGASRMWVTPGECWDAGS